MNPLTFDIRPYTPEDAPFVFSAWCNQIRRVPPLRHLTDEHFREYKVRILEPLLDRAQVLVASNPELDAQSYGFIVAETPDVLHFVYVRSPQLYRRRGVAGALLAAALPAYTQRAPLYATHRTKATDCNDRLARAWRLVYVPQLAVLSQRSQHVSEGALDQLSAAAG